MRLLLFHLFGHHPVLLVAATVWGWVEIAFFPQPMLLLFLAACMFINMVTGAMKAWKTGLFEGVGQSDFQAVFLTPDDFPQPTGGPSL